MITLHTWWSDQPDARGKFTALGVEARCHHCRWVHRAYATDRDFTRAVEVHELQLCPQRSLLAELSAREHSTKVDTTSTTCRQWSDCRTRTQCAMTKACVFA